MVAYSKALRPQGQMGEALRRLYKTVSKGADVTFVCVCVLGGGEWRDRYGWL